MAFILCELSRKDPGGHLANRPLNTLRHIFLPWIPQTIANKNERLEVLNTLSERYPDVAWDLFISLLPKDHDTGWNNSKTRWRKFSEKYENSVTYQEIWDVHTFLVEHLIKMSNNEEDKIAQIVNNMHTFSPIDRYKVVDHIDENFKPEIQRSFSNWHELRKILYRHRSYPNANWSLAEDELKKIEAIFLKLYPTDIIERNVWLFEDHWPTIPEGYDHDKVSHEDHEKKILSKRIQAFNDIYNSVGMRGIIELIPRIKVIEIFGDIASYCIENEVDKLKFFSLLESDEPKHVRFVQNFVFRNSILIGISWVKSNFDKIINLSNKAKSRYFELVPQSKELWDLIESTNKEISEGYWQNCYPRFYHLSVEEKIFGINKLISANRFLSAVDVASHFKKELPSELILEILERAGTLKSNEKAILDGYEIEWLFEELDSRNDFNIEKLVKLEWLYLSVINSLVSTRKPKLLHNELSFNADFFVEVIKWIWKPEPEKNIQNEFEGFSEEEIVRRADIAYQLLYTWNKVPGTDDENHIVEPKLNDWFKQVREKSDLIGRLNPAEIQIGIIFAKFSFDKNNWPPEPICLIIDSINSEFINDGFTSGIINNRGVVTKSFGEGGIQEKELTSTYNSLAIKIATKYPITSSLLLEVSKHYEAESKREDQRAETDDLEF